MSEREDLLAVMYEDGDDDIPNEQPPQLRLAGKATVVNLSGRQIAVPRIEYVEALENRLTEAERLIAEQTAELKRYSRSTSGYIKSILNTLKSRR